MALKDLLSLFDKGLAATFHQAKYDAAKDREKLIKRLEATKAKFLATEPARGRKEYAVANSVVEWSPATPGGGTLFEESPVYVPSERFAEAVEKTVALVSSGAFDARLESAGTTGDAPAAPKARKPRAARDPNKPKAAGREWSPERKARFDATIQARKAAKAAAG